MASKNKTKRLNVAKFSHTLAAGAAALLFLSAAAAYADGPYTMAPPVSPEYQGADYNAPDDSGNASADSVFNWNEVPANQQVPITRAVFDQGGYQLYDNVGETIVVPFSDNNLYVMKFAVSPNDSMFFVNDGDAPVLYVPRDGYLENATVSGARWYPFSEDFHPEEPVFLGCAPSWTAFVDMGWYPGMICHGGFYCDVSFWDGGVFVPCIGLSFIIGGHPCYGWDAFHGYCDAHPGWHSVGFYHPYVYHWADAPHPYGHSFAGGHPWNGSHAWSGSGRNGSGGNHNWSSGDHNWNGGGHSGAASNHNWTGGDHSWSSSDSGHHSFQGAGSSSGWNNRWGGSRDGSSGSGQHSGFQGGSDRSFGGENGSGRTFRGASGGSQSDWGNRSFGGGDRSFSGGDRSFGGNRSFGGGSSSWQDRSSGSHSYGGGSSVGGDRSFSGGGRSYSGGDRSFGGGGGRSFGGDGGHSQDSRGGGGGDSSHSSGGWSGGNGGGGGGGHWGH